MGTVRYTTIAGEVMSENRNGVIRDYLPDSLGSTVGLLDNSQTITDTFEYWPYGEVRVKTGTNPTPFQFVGTQGYHTDSSSKNQVRARTLDSQKGRWMTKDPIGFRGEDWNLYRYVSNNPIVQTDIFGLHGHWHPRPRADPACKTADIIDRAIGEVCYLLKNSTCLNGLSSARRGCLQRMCSRDLIIHCGGPNCDGVRGAYTETFPCRITLCMKTLLNGHFAVIPESSLGTVIRALIHEMAHCCGWLDYPQTPDNCIYARQPGVGLPPEGNNPAEDIARCITGMPGHLNAYW